MKKILGLFAIFNITISSSLSIIGCSKKDEQVVIDNIIRNLKDKVFEVTISNDQEDVLKKMIEEHKEFKEAIVGNEVKLESFKFKKGGTEVTSNFENDTIYDVTLEIKKKNNNNSKAKKGIANFKVKVKISISTSSQQSTTNEDQSSSQQSTRKIEQTNLDTIKLLKNSNGKDLIFPVTSNKFSFLDNQIIQQAHIFEFKNLATNYKVEYASYCRSIWSLIGFYEYKAIDKNQFQCKGEFYVKITANCDDPYWKGSTDWLRFILK